MGRGEVLWSRLGRHPFAAELMIKSSRLASLCSKWVRFPLFVCCALVHIPKPDDITLGARRSSALGARPRRRLFPFLFVLVLCVCLFLLWLLLFFWLFASGILRWCGIGTEEEQSSPRGRRSFLRARLSVRMLLAHEGLVNRSRWTGRRNPDTRCAAAFPTGMGEGGALGAQLVIDCLTAKAWRVCSMW